MQYRDEDKAKLKRLRTKEAITLAMQSRWEEAVAANRSIIEVFPTDVDAYNRLGKALTELGRYDEATKAYEETLAIAPGNAIARRNLRRLAQIKEAKPSPKNGHKVAPRLFIEEIGKTAFARLNSPAPREVLARLAAGDQVNLVVMGQNLGVESVAGEYLGQAEPKLAARLIKLIEGGNRYVAAIASQGDDGVTVMVREVYQHPSQVGRPSFPSKAPNGFRAYVKDSLIKYESEGEAEGEEEEAIQEGGYGHEWEEIDSMHEEVGLLEGDDTEKAVEELE